MKNGDNESNPFRFYRPTKLLHFLVDPFIIGQKIVSLALIDS
jgi:hypothetical protein